MYGWEDGPVHEAFVWKTGVWTLSTHTRKEKKSGHEWSLSCNPSTQEAETASLEQAG